MNYPKGSEWRKWDLHFHTPSSYDYGDKSVTNQDIVDTLKANSISVVAITDHHVIDIDRIKELQKLGGDDLTVLPGIEFLSDAKGRQPVHFIGIFPEDAKLDYVWGQIQNKTEISKVQGEGKNENEVYCHLLDTVKLIHELGGIVSIHAGEKSNSIENITHSLPHSEAQKIDIAFAIDIYELGKESDQTGYREIVFPAIKKELPMIICSDNHNINKYVLKQNCWIKSDPTFEGLKQIIYEPELRVHIGKLSPFEENQKLRLANVKISETKDYPLQDQDLPINGDLVCVIGGRGSGKSSLLETISYCYGQNKIETDSFITHFLNKGAKAKVKIDYLDLQSNIVSDSVVELSLENTTRDPNPILYLGQNQIELIANDKSEIHQLAFNTVRRSSDLSDEFVELQKDIDTLILDLEAINKEIESDRLQVESVDPANLIKEKAVLQKELKLLESEETKSTLKSLSESRKKRDALDKINESVKSIDKGVENLKEKLDPFIRVINIQLQELNIKETASLSYDDLTEKLKALLAKIPQESIKKEYAEIIVKAQDQLTGKTDVSVSYIESLKSKINEIDKKLELFEKDKKVLLDDLSYRIDLLGQLEEVHGELEEVYKHAILEFAKINNGILNQVHLEASHEFHIKKIVNQLFEQLDKRKIKKLDQFLNDYFDNYEGSNFDYIDWLKKFESDPENYNIFYGDGRKVFEGIVYKNYNYLNTKISYQISHDHFKPLNQLSLGQKGTVILKLYLSTGNNCPIIIDQPEDHLDNDFIYSDLVQTLREAKQKRQIIIVTHDANLVVNGDAEQIIVARYDDGKITYPLMGSIENPEVKKSVAKILEGGDIAFKKREKKYNIQEVN